MKDTTIVGRNIVGIEEKTFLHLAEVSEEIFVKRISSHLLKLVTGVDISTLPVNRSGREGKAKNKSSLTAAAEP